MFTFIVFSMFMRSLIACLDDCSMHRLNTVITSSRIDEHNLRGQLSGRTMGAIVVRGRAIHGNRNAVYSLGHVPRKFLGSNSHIIEERAPFPRQHRPPKWTKICATQIGVTTPAHPSGCIPLVMHIWPIHLILGTSAGTHCLSIMQKPIYVLLVRQRHEL